MKKKILIDLTILKNVNCGLGQVALNYGFYFRDHYQAVDNERIYLLVPKSFVGEFGDKVSYLTPSVFKKLAFPFPRITVWHAIHQLTKYKPFWPSTRYLLTVHDLNFLKEKAPKKAQVYLKRLQEKIDRANRITAISNFTREDMLRNLYIGDRSVEVIYNGVEQMVGQPQSRPEAVDASKPFFFSIGEMNKKKNFAVLLDMMRAFPNENLYLAGNDNTAYAAELQERIRRENLTNIKLLGKVTHAEKLWLYANCRAFMFPSLLEGFGLPVVEAMEFGRPVFSSDQTSLKEIGDRHAFFWHSFEARDMAETVRQGLATFDASSEPMRAEIEYARSFSYARHMERYLEIYRSL